MKLSKNIKNTLPIILIFGLIFLMLTSCQKWKDNPGQPLNLTNKYCNIPSAINYNYGFPGVVDNSVCILPSTPFVGKYVYTDSIYNTANALVSILTPKTIEISSIDSTRLKVSNFCDHTQDLIFVANKYYRAVSDSVIGIGIQLMCRPLDTLSGKLEFRQSDSSLLIDFNVISDTAVMKHIGRAYKI